jgi:hypothetical protein
MHGQHVQRTSCMASTCGGHHALPARAVDIMHGQHVREDIMHGQHVRRTSCMQDAVVVARGVWIRMRWMHCSAPGAHLVATGGVSPSKQQRLHSCNVPPSSRQVQRRVAFLQHKKRGRGRAINPGSTMSPCSALSA